MSVGGRVVETVVLDDRVWINTVEKSWSPKQQRFCLGDRCAIYVERSDDADLVAVGDTVWWQGRTAYWTSVVRGILEKELQRIGYSGAPRPDGD